MKYYDFLKLISTKENIPTTVEFLGIKYNISSTDEKAVIDYYSKGTALSEVIASHLLQDQADFDLIIK